MDKNCSRSGLKVKNGVELIKKCTKTGLELNSNWNIGTFVGKQNEHCISSLFQSGFSAYVGLLTL